MCSTVIRDFQSDIEYIKPFALNVHHLITLHWLNQCIDVLFLEKYYDDCKTIYNI